MRYSCSGKFFLENARFERQDGIGFDQGFLSKAQYHLEQVRGIWVWWLQCISAELSQDRLRVDLWLELFWYSHEFLLIRFQYAMFHQQKEQFSRLESQIFSEYQFSRKWPYPHGDACGDWGTFYPLFWNEIFQFDNNLWDEMNLPTECFSRYCSRIILSLTHRSGGSDCCREREERCPMLWWRPQ